MLAVELSGHVGLYGGILVALARGGVPVGVAVAEALNLPLDVLAVRKIGVPWQPELAMGAMAGSVQILDHEMIRALAVSDEELTQVIARENAEMRRRASLYYANADRPELQGRTVILVDDGLATGNTMMAAVHHVRSLNPARIIIAVPVGSRQGCNQLRGAADKLVCLATPAFFGVVGEWYLNFGQVSDNEVISLLARSHQGHAAITAPSS